MDQGCLSDGVIGAWMANIYGIDTPLALKNVLSTLQAIFRNNFKTDLSQHANAQRPGYAMGHEPGLLLCTWPRGGKPTLPFVYSDEVWTGFEYEVASYLIHEGFVEEGLTIVKAASQPIRWAHAQSVERVRVRQLVRTCDVQLRAGWRLSLDSVTRPWNGLCTLGQS